MSQYEWTVDDLESGGNWDSVILGSIATHLTQLKTWDQAVKELVQNADDAKATEILFSISETAITVSNNSYLTYCNFPNESYKACDFKDKTKNDYCDLHAIKTLSSQNKRKNSEATGKFGIGFVSTFLFTDQPTISSGNIRMTFLPAQDKIPVKVAPDRQEGTIIYLPWAMDPESPVRIGLEKPAIDLNQIPEIVCEIVESCIRSFIFVRNLQNIKVSMHSTLKLDLTREKNGDEIVITDVLSDKSTSWLLLKSDSQSSGQLDSLRKTDRNFESRRVEFEVLIPRELNENFSGLLYATLATNQRTYMPFHINADFFPDTSRNNLSFKDRGNERDPAALWNRTVISQCAKFVGAKLSTIHELVGNRVVWNILEGSYTIAKRKTGEIVPECFDDFWSAAKIIASVLPLIEDQFDSYCLPQEISLLTPHSKKHVSIMNELELSFQKDTRSIHLEICQELGATNINQKVLASSLRKLLAIGKIIEFLQSEDILDSLYSIIEKTLQSEDALLEELQELPIWLTSRNAFVNFSELNMLNSDMDDEVFFTLFTKMVLSSKVFANFPILQTEIQPITGERLVNFLVKQEHQTDFLESKILKDDSSSAFDFLFSCISSESLSDLSIERLRNMEIWPHSNGHFSSLLNSTLPGSFVDPIGVGRVLDRVKLGQLASTALVGNLRVKELSLAVYVLELLPSFFTSGELNLVQAQELTIQFVNHQEEFDQQMILKLQSFPFILVAGSLLRFPASCLYPSDLLLKLCAPKYFSFIDIEKLELLQFSEKSKLESFLRKIGVVFDPSFELLSTSWKCIQEDIDSRDSESLRLSDVAESFLDIWNKKSKISKVSENALPTADLLWPCKNKCASWHSPSELIQAKWSRVICDREKLHEVGVAFGKRSRDSIEEFFSIAHQPDTSKVNEHLEHCVRDAKHPGDDFYRYLNWLSGQEDASEKMKVEYFRDVPFIFQEGEFWIPRDIYLAIPSNLKFLANFVHYIDKAPKGHESLWTVLGIGAVAERDVARYFPRIKDEILETESSEVDLSKYASALSIIGAAFEAEEFWAQEFLDEFRSSEYLLTISNEWIQPEFGIIADNDDWAFALENYFASNLVRVHAAAYELILSAGACRLTDALEVHEESLSIEGEADTILTSDFRERSEAIYSLLANQIIDSPGGSFQVYESAIPRLDRLRSLTINPVGDIQVRVTLRFNEISESIEVTQAPPLYLSNSNSVIFVRNKKESFISIFSAILFEFIPRLTSEKILDSASKFLLAMQKDPRDLMDWLETNGYLKHDISPPVNDELRPSIIDLKNKDEIDNENTNDWDADSDTQHSRDVDDNVVDEENEESPNKFQTTISTDSDPEPKRNLQSPEPKKSNASPRSIPAINTPTSGQKLADIIRKSGASSKVETGGDPDGNGQSEPSSQKSGATIRKQNYNGKRRRSGFAHAEAEKGDGLSSIHNSEVDEAGIKWVKEKEWEIRRKVIDMNETERNHKGFDLLSVSDANQDDIRLIEVKSCSGYWPDLGVGLSRAQFEVSIREGYQSWLYVVENALEPDPLKRLHRIQDPWANIRSVYFDPGWQDLAEVSVQQNPISLVEGLRVWHREDGFGWIASEPTRQGQSIHCRILFDKTLIEKPVRWDDRFFEVITGDDDNS